MNQLGLPFALDSKMLLGCFVGEKNQQIVKYINQLFEGDTSAVAYIYGDKSSGKTHLLQGVTLEALERGKQAAYIDFKQTLPQGIFSTLENFDWLCLDNISCLNESQQTELFDLYNRTKHNKVKLIVSDLNPPNALNLLKDLCTRLSQSTVFSLEHLSDLDKKNILKGKMAERNININDSVYEYLIKYCSRDLTLLLSTINQLDQTSLELKKPITVAFVKKILKI